MLTLVWLAVGSADASQRVCVVDGGQYPGYTNTMECYNPVTASWELQPFETTHIAAEGAMALIDGLNCMFEQTPPECLTWNGVSWGWVGRPDYQQLAVSTIISNSFGYVGDTLCYMYDTTPQCFDNVLKMWVTKTNLIPNQPRKSHAAFQLPDGRLCIAGGWLLAGCTASCQINSTECLDSTDPDTAVFSTVAPMSVEREDPAALYQQGNIPCVLGGKTKASTVLDSVECFDNGVWTLHTPVPSVMSYPATFQLTIGGDWCVMIPTNVYCWNGVAWQPFASPNIPRDHALPFVWDDASLAPTAAPTTSAPTPAPTTSAPTPAPTTLAPSLSPTRAPSLAPTRAPTLPSFELTVDSSSVVEVGTLTQLQTVLITPSLSSFSVSYLWTLTPAISASTSISYTSSTLTIPAYTLSPNTYTATVKATSSSFSPANASAQFTVVAAPVVASIVLPNRQIVQGTAFSLDASGSLDPNVRTQDLSFSWDCIPACPPALSLPIRALSVLPVDVSTSGSLVIGTHLFTVTVTSSSSYSPQSGTATASVTVVAPSVIPVSLLLNPLPLSITTDGVALVSPSSSIGVVSVIPDSANPSTLNYSWSVQPAVPTSCIGSGGVNGRTFVVLPNCIPANSTAAITLTVRDPARPTSTGLATISFIINLAPEGGSCSASPTTGVALETTFALICGEWTSAVALSYAFQLTGVDGVTRTFAQNSLGSAVYTVLPAGNPVNITALITDTLGSTVQTSIFVVVAPPVVPPTCLDDLARLQTLNATKGNTPSILQAVQLSLLDLRYPNSTTPCPADKYLAAWEAAIAVLVQLVNNSVGIAGSASSSAQTLSETFLLTVEAAPTSTALSGAVPSLLIITDAFFPIPQIGVSAGVYVPLTYALSVILDAASQCTQAEHALQQLNQISTRFVGATLPGQALSILTAASTTTVLGSFYDDSRGSLTGQSVLVSLTPALLSAHSAGAGNDGSGVASVVVSEHGTLARCRQPSPGQAVVSNVVDIVIADKLGQAMPNITLQKNGAFSFLVDTNVICPSSSNLACSWWNQQNQKWTGTGCTTTSISGSSKVNCTCTHLTEFAIILLDSTGGVDCEAVRLKNGFVAIMAIQAIEAVFALVVVVLLLRLRQFAAVTTQHCLLLAVATLRALEAALLSGYIKASIRGSIALLVLPYIITFWCYTLMVFQWLSLYHFPMEAKAGGFGKVRGLFLTTNAAVVVCMIVTSVMLGVDSSSSDVPSQRQTTVATVASAIIASVTALSALGFMIYSCLIYKLVKHSLVSSGTANRTSCGLALHTRMLIGGLALSVLLIAESALHAASIANKLGAYESVLALLCVDAVIIAVFLAMYNKAVRNMMKPTAQKKTLQLSDNHNHLSSNNNNDIYLPTKGGKTQ